MKKLLPILLGILFVVLAWYRLVVCSSDMLFEAQQQSFWQPGSLYWHQISEQPGGLFSWCGQFLTQFLYYPALGSAILILMWLVIYACTLLGCRLPWYLSWVALIVPSMLLWAETSVNYGIYISKVPDWCFTPTVFWLVVALLLLVGRWMGKWVRVPWVAVCAVTGIVMSHQWMQDAAVPEPLRTPYHSMVADDAAFAAEIRMEHAAEQAQWGEVLREMRQSEAAPTRAMWLYKNIALLNQGRLTEAWLDYNSLTEMPHYSDSIIVPMVESQGPMLYFLHGSIEFAYRWSMENMVEYGPSYKRLRLMVHCALIKGEWDLAERYLNMMSRTMFYRDWAEEHRQYLRRPDLIMANPLYSMAMRLSRARYNLLDGDESKAESYLLRSYSMPQSSACRELAQLSVIYAMQTQNIQTFWPAFIHYANLHADQPMPKLLQQAVYLFVQLEPQSAPQSSYPFDPEISKTYQQFNARAQQYMKQGMGEKALAEAMRHEFGRTYYWFYFLARNLNTY